MDKYKTTRLAWKTSSLVLQARPRWSCGWSPTDSAAEGSSPWLIMPYWRVNGWNIPLNIQVTKHSPNISLGIGVASKRSQSVLARLTSLLQCHQGTLDIYIYTYNNNISTSMCVCVFVYNHKYITMDVHILHHVVSSSTYHISFKFHPKYILSGNLT